MNIMMMTNTFTPHVGGVARSIESFVAQYRKCGHRVMVVAPEFDDAPEHETDVIRIPAVQNFNGSDFSVILPVPKFLTKIVDEFQPDVIHSHHPFLIGTTAVRVAHTHQLPLVFTNHTLYERYTHYVPGDSNAIKRFVIKLAASYANICDHVFAPSESIAKLLVEREVSVPISVVPTGVDLAQFAQGSGSGFRAAIGIDEDAFVIGHLGRLAKEKNLEYLAQAVSTYLREHRNAHFLVVGSGPYESVIREWFSKAGVEAQLHMIGALKQPLLCSAYRSMDVFAFSSTSETQGMVLAEAMAVGTPVVALDGPGVRDIVRDRHNGVLLSQQSSLEAFARALQWIRELPAQARTQMQAQAIQSAEAVSLQRTADNALQIYQQLQREEIVQRSEEYNVWRSITRMIEAEWGIFRNVAGAASAAFSDLQRGD